VNALGIFQGKKRTYNELILKSLVFSPKTVMQIAEHIYHNTKQKVRHNPVNVKRSIFSVIDRPHGRLQELSGKQYIEKSGGKWQLTFKGFCVALTLFESLDKVKPFIVFDQMVKSQLFKMFDKHPLYASIKTDVVDERVKEGLKRIEGDSRFGELLLLKLKEYTDGLIKEGVDLDVLSGEEFTGLIGGRLVSWFLERYVS
jgi:hypothetical protein